MNRMNTNYILIGGIVVVILFFVVFRTINHSITIIIIIIVTQTNILHLQLVLCLPCFGYGTRPKVAVECLSEPGGHFERRTRDQEQVEHRHLLRQPNRDARAYDRS